MRIPVYGALFEGAYFGPGSQFPPEGFFLPKCGWLLKQNDGLQNAAQVNLMKNRLPGQARLKSIWRLSKFTRSGRTVRRCPDP